MTLSKIFSKNKTYWIFLGLLIVMFFVYRYPYSIRKGPFSIHYWRQSSGTSIARNYEKENIGFFEPTIHWTGDGDSGKTVVEFPILYYIVGKIWKWVGHREFIFRLLNLLIVYTGLFYLFRFLKEFLRDDFWAVLLPLLLFTSPTLVYYADNTLMDAPAFGLVLIGAYYYWRYSQSGKTFPLCLSMSFFLMAGLLKLSALLLFTAILLIHLFANLRFFKKTYDLQRWFRPVHLIPFAIVIGVNLGWTLWAMAYNARNVEGVFLQGLNPIWNVNLYEGLYIGTLFYTQLLGSIFNVPALYISLILLLWMLFDYRKVNPFLLILTILSLGGSLLYILLFFRAMNVHDYYLVNLVIVIPLILLTFLHYLQTNHPALFHNRGLKSIALIGLILLIYSTMVDQRARYDINDTFVKHTIVLENRKRDMYRYYQQEYASRFRSLESIEPYLRGLGIKREDKVVSIPDGSPNYTLYLMDQKGVTDYGYGNLREAERMEHFIRTGAKYLIVNDPVLLNRDYLQPYLRHKMGQYENVSVFRLEKSAEDNTGQGEG